jgi:aspartate/methionine/tyrosine aminotransferase
MKLQPFLLDRWLEQKFSADPPIEYDLASSTGPVWTYKELLSLAGESDPEWLMCTKLIYTSPAGSLELREAIAGLQGVDPEHVQVTTGAAEALLVLFMLAADSGANVVLPNPGFPTNAALADTFRIETRFYSLRAENNFEIDPDEIRRLVDHNTRLVLVNSPHNPTGAVLSEKSMASLHDFCAERGVQFVSDEVYHPIYHGAEVPSASRLPHATVLGDFSKALCLSGLRIGWVIERDSERRTQLLNARSYFTVSNTAVGEKLATLALKHREQIYGRARRVSQANLALLDGLIRENGDILRWVRPGGGMTAFPWLASGADARDFCRRVAKRGVLMAPGDCFGAPAHFRLGFAATGDKFPKALERFGEFLKTEARSTASVA